MSKSEETYRKLLGRHDWYYNFSDDYSVWSKGKKNLADIFGLQPDVDADFKIYNEYAPDDFKRNQQK